MVSARKISLGLVHNCSGCHGMSTKCLTKTFSFRRFIRQSVMRSLWIYWIKNVKQEKSWDANHLLNGFMMNQKFSINVVILFCITISTYIVSYIRFMEMRLWYTNYIYNPCLYLWMLFLVILIIILLLVGILAFKLLHASWSWRWKVPFENGSQVYLMYIHACQATDTISFLILSINT